VSGGGRGRAGAWLLAAAIAVSVALVLALRGGGGADDAGDGRVDRLAREPGGADALLGAGEGLEAIDGSRAGPSRAPSEGASRVRLAGPGRLVGRVLDRGADGAPVPGVTVRLLPVPPVGAAVAPEVANFIGLGDDFGRRTLPIAEAPTGAGGAFAFEGVREGRWFLDVVSERHFVDGAPRARVLESGSGGPVDVWVRSGGRVVGRVVDADGAPVAGADLALGTGAMRFLEAAGDGEIALRRATTDEDGRFEIAGIPAAEGYELSALGPGISITHVNDIDVEVGEATEVLVRGRPTARITGRILGAATGGEAAPLEGARVGALPRGLRNLKLAREILVRTHAVTGPDGAYVLDGLSPGETDVIAIADGHLPGRGPLVRVPEGGDAAAPDFTLARGPLVDGRVVDAATGAPVPGARVLWNILDFDEIEGQPTLAPLVVGAMRDFSYPVTDGEGRFRAGPFPKEPPYEVRVLAPGYAAARASWDPAEGAEVVIEISRGGSVAGVVTDAATGEPVTAFAVGVDARVEANAAAPSALNPFADEVLFEAEDGRFRVSPVAPGLRTLTFLADGYRDLELDVAVAPGASDDAPLLVSLDPGGTIRGVVTDGEGEPVAGAQVTTDRLMRASFARLEATRAVIEDTLAIEGQPTRPTPPVGFLRYAAALGLVERGVVTTGPDGAFALSGLDPGAHEVLAFHRDFETAAVPAALGGEPGAEVTVEVALSAGATVFGTLEDRHGRPIVDGTVVLASPGLMAGTGAGDLRQARTGEGGAYEVTNVSGGPYVVLSTHGDDELAVSSFFGALQFGFLFVPPAGRLRHDIVDASSGGCVVSGRVTRGGAPVTDGILVATPEGGGRGILGIEFSAAPIENDGSYVFEGLEPGPHRVTFEERGQRRRGRVGEGRGGSVDLDVPDAPELRFDVELPEGGVTGRVVARDDGEPIVDVRVLVEPAGAGERAARASLLGVDLGDAAATRVARTDAEGRFVVRDLAPGDYVVESERATLRREDGPIALMAPAPLAFQVTGDRLVDVGEIALEPGLGVRGRVQDEDGVPVVGARGVATWAGASGGFATSASAESGDAGAFALDGLRAGPWRLRASADGFADAAATRVDVGPASSSEEAVLTLRRGVEVDLVVTDAATGAPRVGVAVTVRRVGEEAAAEAEAGGLLRRFFSGEATTDAEGRLDLGRLERGAAYELRLQADGGVETRPLEIGAGSGSSRTVRVALP